MTPADADVIAALDALREEVEQLLALRAARESHARSCSARATPPPISCSSAKRPVPRGPAGRPFVGSRRQAARGAPRVDRAEPRAGVHRQRAEVPAAQQPRPAAGRRSTPASPICGGRSRSSRHASSARWATSPPSCCQAGPRASPGCTAVHRPSRSAVTRSPVPDLPSRGGPLHAGHADDAQGGLSSAAGGTVARRAADGGGGSTAGRGAAGLAAAAAPGRGGHALGGANAAQADLLAQAAADPHEPEPDEVLPASGVEELVAAETGLDRPATSLLQPTRCRRHLRPHPPTRPRSARPILPRRPTGPSPTQRPTPRRRPTSSQIPMRRAARRRLRPATGATRPLLSLLSAPSPRRRRPEGSPERCRRCSAHRCSGHRRGRAGDGQDDAGARAPARARRARRRHEPVVHAGAELPRPRRRGAAPPGPVPAQSRARMSTSSPGTTTWGRGRHVRGMARGRERGAARRGRAPRAAAPHAQEPGRTPVRGSGLRSGGRRGGVGGAHRAWSALRDLALETATTACSAALCAADGAVVAERCRWRVPRTPSGCCRSCSRSSRKPGWSGPTSTPSPSAWAPAPSPGCASASPRRAPWRRPTAACASRASRRRRRSRWRCASGRWPKRERAAVA